MIVRTVVRPTATDEVALRVRSEIRKQYTYYWFEVCHNGSWHKHEIHVKQNIRFLTAVTKTARTIPERKAYDEKRLADLTAENYMRGKSGWGNGYIVETK